MMHRRAWMRTARPRREARTAERRERRVPGYVPVAACVRSTDVVLSCIRGVNGIMQKCSTDHVQCARAHSIFCRKTKTIDRSLDAFASDGRGLTKVRLLVEGSLAAVTLISISGGAPDTIWALQWNS